MEAVEPNTIEIIIYSVVGILLLILAILAILIPVNIQIIKTTLRKLLDAQKNTKNNDFYNKKILESLQEIRSNTCNYQDE